MMMPSGRGDALALVGCGTIGSLRAAVAREDRAIGKIVLFDIDRGRAEQLARSLGSIAEVASTVEEAVGRSEVAGVFVSTPEHLHCDPALAAIEARKPVLVEKPLAHDLRSARSLQGAAEQAGTPLYVGYTQRFRHRYMNAKEQVAKGKLGKLSSLLGKRYLSRAVSQKIAGRTDRVTPASDSLTYLVDLSLWYFEGREPVNVVARSNYVPAADGTGRRPEATWAIVEMEGGAVCSLSVAWQLPTFHPTSFVIGLDIFGNRGFLSVDDSHREVIMSSEVGADLLYTPDLSPRVSFVGATPAGEWAGRRFWGPLRYETQAFLESVFTDEPHPILTTAREACRTLSVTEAIDAAALSGKAASVGPEYF